MSASNVTDADSVSKTTADGSAKEIIGVGEEHPKEKSWISRALFQFFCLLWLVPILFMLVKNFQGWIIGAGAWCPGGHCWADIFDNSLGNVWQTAHRLDSQSHDLVGALQFVAKALEVWFIIIATSFVYLYTMWLAERSEGLPVRYLTWPSEFSDITSIFSRSLWTVAYSTRNKDKKGLWSLPFFVAITVFLCVLCALMGPSVAVVIIPSLQWIPTPPQGHQVFDEVSSGSPPDPNLLMETLRFQYGKGHKRGHFQQWCSEPELAAGNYSCTTDTLGLALDTMIEESTGYYHSPPANQPNFGLVQEFGTSCIIYNTTDQQVSSNIAFWTPNRQVLREIGAARFIVAAASNGYEAIEDYSVYKQYQIFNRSLEMRIQRNGPMIGARPNIWQPEGNNAWTTFIDTDRSIRCYPQFSILWKGEPGPPTTKCIRLGTGWNSNNKQLNFSIAGGVNPTTGNDEPNTKVAISFSDKAAYFPGSALPSWLPSSCLSDKKNGAVPVNATCDWDRLFSLEVPSLANRTQNLNTWDFFSADDTSAPMFSVDFVAYLGFSLYQLDPSPSVNPLALVQPLVVPDTGPSLVIDPEWAALAWSVDTSSGMVPANRSSIIQYSYGIYEDQTYANFVVLYAILNMLTQIPYSTAWEANAKVDDQHPLLQLTGSIYVYAYAINSRTSVFSVVIVIIGCVVVLAHFLLRIWFHRPQRSIKEVVISALEHRPQGEFEGVNSGQEAVKTRFKVEHSHQSLGELVFRRQH